MSCVVEFVAVTVIAHFFDMSDTGVELEELRGLFSQTVFFNSSGGLVT